MKIFQVINVRWFNATAWYALYLSKLLHDAGHEVTVIVQPGTPPEEKAREMGLDTVPVDLNSVNPLRLGPAIRDITQLLNKRRPHIVNCHRGEGFILWCLLKKFYGYSVVRTRGDQRLPKSNLVNKWLHGTLADGVVTTNRRMAEHFLHTMSTPEQSVWLIHGGVDRTIFNFDEVGRKRVRDELGYTDNDFVVGLLGRFDKVKGQRELMQSFALLKAQGMDNLRLLLAGYDTAMKLEEIQNEIKRMGLEDVVTITGRRNDVAACISAMDLGVVNSLWSEAIARAALEIMACERPLVSTNVNVMPDLVPEKGLVEPDNIEAMADLIERAATDERFLADILAKEQSTISQLSGEEFLRRTLVLYKRLAGNNL